MVKDISRRGFMQIFVAAAAASAEGNLTSFIPEDVLELVQYDKIPNLISETVYSGAREVIDIDNGVCSALDQSIKLFIKLTNPEINLNKTTLNQTMVSIAQEQLKQASGSGAIYAQEILGKMSLNKNHNVTLRDFINAIESEISNTLNEILNKLQETIDIKERNILTSDNFASLEKLLNNSKMSVLEKRKYAKLFTELNNKAIEIIISNSEFNIEKLPEFKDEKYKIYPENNTELDYEVLLPSKPFLEGFDFSDLQNAEKRKIMKPEEGMEYKSQFRR